MSGDEDQSGRSRKKAVALGALRTSGRDSPMAAHSASSASCLHDEGRGVSPAADRLGCPVVFATALTAIAGFLDAAAFVEFNHLYASFMSGNSTHLGTALATGGVPDILVIGCVVVAFVSGAGVGTWIADRTGAGLVVPVLRAEIVLLVGAVAAIEHRHLSLALVAAAMGMQNTLHQAIAGADVGKGFITGALFGAGQSMARVLRDGGAGLRAASNMLSWCAFVVGAALGTLALGFLGFAGCLAAAIAMIVAMAAALASRRR